jgi:hypothetical protein
MNGSATERGMEGTTVDVRLSQKRISMIPKLRSTIV